MTPKYEQYHQEPPHLPLFIRKKGGLFHSCQHVIRLLYPRPHQPKKQKQKHPMWVVVSRCSSFLYLLGHLLSMYLTNYIIWVYIRRVFPH